MEGGRIGRFELDYMVRGESVVGFGVGRDDIEGGECGISGKRCMNELCVDGGECWLYLLIRCRG